MANNIKGLTVEIGGDTTKLGKALENVNKKSSTLSKELGQINKLLKLDPGNADLLAQKQKVLAEAVANTREKLDKLKEAEAQVQEQFKRGEVSEEQVRELQREIITTTKKLETYERAAQETNDEIDKLGDESEEAEKEVKELGDETDKTGEKLDDAGDKATTFGDKAKKAGELAVKGLAAIGAVVGAAIGALTSATVSAAGYADEMLTLSTVTGISTDELQAFSYASELVDVSLETLTKSMAKNIKSMSSASQGSKLYAEAYEALGVAVTDADGNLRDSETVYWEAVDALGQMANETERDAIAMQLFGKSAQELNPLIEAGSEKMKELKQEAKDVGAVMSEESLAALGAFDDSIQRFKGSAGAAKNVLGGVLLPELQLLTDTGTDLLTEFTQKLSDSGGGLDGFVTTISGMSGTLVSTVSDLATKLLGKVTELAPTVVSIALGLVTSLATSLLSMAPQLLSTGFDLITTLITGLSSALPQLLSMGFELVMNLIQGLASALPEIFSQGAQILTSLGQGIGQNLPSLVERALDALMNFATTLYDNAPMLIEAGLDLIMNLAQGLMDSLPILIEKGPEIISKFANVINDNAPKILAKGVQLIVELVKGIIKAIPTLVANIPKIITAIVDVWEAFNWVNLGKKAITLLKDGVLKMVSAVKSAGTTVMNTCTSALQSLPSKLFNIGKSALSNLAQAIRNGVSSVKSGATSILNGVVNTLKGLPSRLTSIGADLVRGLWYGISDMTGWVIGKIQGFGDSVISGLKSFFGIASPSKVMRKLAKWLPIGMAYGIEDEADAPLKAMRNLNKDLANEAGELNGLTLEREIKNTFARPSAAAQQGLGLSEKLDKILTAIELGQILTIDGDALVGATVDRLDNKLGQRRALAARRAI